MLPWAGDSRSVEKLIGIISNLNGPVIADPGTQATKINARMMMINCKAPENIIIPIV